MEQGWFERIVDGRAQPEAILGLWGDGSPESWWIVAGLMAVLKPSWGDRLVWGEAEEPPAPVWLGCGTGRSVSPGGWSPITHLADLYDLLTAAAIPFTQWGDLWALGMWFLDRPVAAHLGAAIAQGLRQWTEASPSHRHRPGLEMLRRDCDREKDRPLDRWRGVGSRLRWWRSGVEAVGLLVGEDRGFCRQVLQNLSAQHHHGHLWEQQVWQDIQSQWRFGDPSTIQSFIWGDRHWWPPILPTVARRFAHLYHCPVLLYHHDGTMAEAVAAAPSGFPLATLLAQQQPWLRPQRGERWRFALADLPMVAESWQHHSQRLGGAGSRSPFWATVTLDQIDQELFEQCFAWERHHPGEGPPLFLVQGCCFQGLRTQSYTHPQKIAGSLHRWLGRVVSEATPQRYDGVWWCPPRGEEMTMGPWDLVVELAKGEWDRQYQDYLRIWAVLPPQDRPTTTIALEDYRGRSLGTEASLVPVHRCPPTWEVLQIAYGQARQQGKNLALAYDCPTMLPFEQVWPRLLGMVKYLHHSDRPYGLSQLLASAALSPALWPLAQTALARSGWRVVAEGEQLRITSIPTDPAAAHALAQLHQAIGEQIFLQQFFLEAPCSTLGQVLQENPSELSDSP